jgi:hypothetical protein
MARQNLMVSLFLILALLQSVFSLSDGYYTISSGGDNGHGSMSLTRDGRFAIILQPRGSSEDDWFITNHPSGGVVIRVPGIRLHESPFLKTDGSDRNSLVVLSEGHDAEYRWNLTPTGENPEEYFIEPLGDGPIGGNNLGIGYSFLRIFPPRVALTDNKLKWIFTPVNQP